MGAVGGVSDGAGAFLQGLTSGCYLGRSSVLLEVLVYNCQHVFRYLGSMLVYFFRTDDCEYFQQKTLKGPHETLEEPQETFIHQIAGSFQLDLEGSEKKKTRAIGGSFGLDKVEWARAVG